MKRILSKKWVKAICFILAAVSLPVSVCGAIVLGVCMDRGFTVTDDLRITGENLSFREQALKNITDRTRDDVLNGMYNCFVYDITETYLEYTDIDRKSVV